MQAVPGVTSPLPIGARLFPKHAVMLPSPRQSFASDGRCVRFRWWTVPWRTGSFTSKLVPRGAGSCIAAAAVQCCGMTTRWQPAELLSLLRGLSRRSVKTARTDLAVRHLGLSALSTSKPLISVIVADHHPALEQSSCGTSSGTSSRGPYMTSSPTHPAHLAIAPHWLLASSSYFLYVRFSPPPFA
jgi:hypothetical protein